MNYMPSIIGKSRREDSYFKENGFTDDIMALVSESGIALKRICKTVGAFQMNYTIGEMEHVCGFIENNELQSLVLNEIGTRWITRNSEGNIVLHWQEHPNPEAISSIELSPDTATALIEYVDGYKQFAKEC
jgi:hypothetical protein